MSSFDAAAAARRFADDETDELIRIAFVQSGDYVPEAVALAREELRRRGVEDTAAAPRIEVAREEEAARQKVAAKPLDAGMRIVCFVPPFLVGLIIARNLDVGGKHHAAEQARVWTGLGWLTRTALLVGVLLTA